MKLQRRRGGLRVELTPLIDVIFLLLTFFVFSLVLMVRADVLDVSLPTLGTGRPASSGPVVTVAIDESGTTFVNGEAVALDALVDRVRAEQEVDPDTALVLAIDERSEAGTLVRVAERLAGAGLGEFTILGRPAPAPSPASNGAGGTGPANPGEGLP